MMSSRGMGAIRKDKIPRGKTMRRKDGDKFTMYAEGGEVKSKGKQFVTQPKNIAKKTAGYR